MTTTYDFMNFTALEKDILTLIAVLFQTFIASIFVGYSSQTQNFSTRETLFIEFCLYILELVVGFIVCLIIDLTPVLNTTIWI